MTPTTPWTLTAPLVCALMTASCAGSVPTSAPPPRLPLPGTATAPCQLPRLPERPTVADLEVGYVERGAALAHCDAARALAVDTLLAERALQDRWRAETRP